MVTILEQLSLEVGKAFAVLRQLAPDSEGGPWEEAVWRLEKVRDSLRCMRLSCEDIVFETQRAIQALEAMDGEIQAKVENPYRQADFITFSSGVTSHAHR